MKESFKTFGNNTAFAMPLTDEAAYWVGFLMADGCVNYKDEIEVFLHERDVAHLEKLRKFLCSRTNLYVARRVLGTYVKFYQRSKQITTDLAQYGVVPRKTRIAEAVGVEHNRHFWRGVIDGDGWLGEQVQNGRRSPALTLVSGSRRLAEQFADFVRTITLHWSGDVCATGKSGKNWRVTVSCASAREVIRVLYNDCTVALSRKAEKATHLLSLPHKRENTNCLISAGEETAIVFLYNSGLSMRDVAHNMNTTPQSVFRHLKKEMVTIRTLSEARNLYVARSVAA